MEDLWLPGTHPGLHGHAVTARRKLKGGYQCHCPSPKVTPRLSRWRLRTCRHKPQVRASNHQSRSEPIFCFKFYTSEIRSEKDWGGEEVPQGNGDGHRGVGGRPDQRCAVWHQPMTVAIQQQLQGRVERVFRLQCPTGGSGSMLSHDQSCSSAPVHRGSALSRKGNHNAVGLVLGASTCMVGRLIRFALLYP